MLGLTFGELFVVVFVLLVVVSAPWWPALAESLVRGDDDATDGIDPGDEPADPDQ